MRLSGVLLLVLALGHVAIMHVINNVDVISYDWVVARWASLFWRSYDVALLFLALLHGANGVRAIVDDHVRTQPWHRIALGALAITSIVTLLLGAYVLFTFQPKPG
jgi:succinate dehydrogenase / fumarate reductase membrane anchor subunit